MEVHDLVRRMPSERGRRWLSVTFRVTPDPVPDWLGPGQAAAGTLLLVGFAGLPFVHHAQDLCLSLITLGALGTLVLRLLCLRWAPAILAGPWPRAADSGDLTVTVTDAGPAPLRVAKAVHDATGVSLVAARRAVLAGPTPVLAGADLDAAFRVADVLRAAGAEVTVTPAASPADVVPG